MRHGAEGGIAMTDEIKRLYDVKWRQKDDPGALDTPYGIFRTGQGADGYGSKITTDRQVWFKDRWYRVYATCYSNTASHWVLSCRVRYYISTWGEEDKDAVAKG